MKIKLYQGNCLEVFKSPDFLNRIKNRKIIIVTDPPFNIGYHYNNYKDNLNEQDYMKFLNQVFTAIPNAGLVIIHYPEALYKIAFMLNEVPERVVSWVYNSNTARQHRDIAFFNVKPDFRKVLQPYKNPSDKRIQERIKSGKLGCKIYDWWNVNQVKNVSKKDNSHPCVMPVEVMKNIIGILPDDCIILDPFMGSGTTGVACKSLNKDFIGIELDENYYNIAKERLGN